MAIAFPDLRRPHFLALAALLEACSGIGSGSRNPSTGGVGGSGEAMGTGGATMGGMNSGGAGATSSGGAVTAGTSSGGASSGGAATGGASSGGTSTGGTNTGGAGGTGGTVAAIPFRPNFILGADISWVLEDEAGGARYFEGTAQRSLEQILANNGFNYVRIRTFVNPCASGGYATSPILYASDAVLPKECWCDAPHSIALAKRARACGMGVLLDFHMSDTWASIGVQTVPSAWAGLGTSALQQAAHDYVKSTLQQMIAAGVEPDMVQIGNEINSHMSGVSISNWTNFSGIVNAGTRAVREVDPRIVIVEQHGRPRPDGNFIPWVDEFVNGNPAIDFDVVGGSTYGTTNNGADWQDQFGQVVGTYRKPVMSTEYTGDKTSLINGIIHDLPNSMGWGTFIWEPTRYGTPLFSLSGHSFTTNSRMAAYPPLARSYGLPVPSGACR